MEIEGIMVDRGFLHVNTFIGKEYIKSLSHEGAILDIIPVDEHKGAEVYDVDGKKIGKVKEVKREGNTNNIVSIIVDRGFAKGEIVVHRDDLDSIGESIILKSTVEEEIRQKV